MQLKFLKPNRKKILLTIGLFILFQALDMKYGFGGGLGFPIKYWALGLPGLSAGFSYPLYFIIDILFFYVLSALFFHSRITKIIVALILLTVFVVVDKPYQGYCLSQDCIEQSKVKMKSTCESIGKKWTEGTGDILGTCQ